MQIMKKFAAKLRLSGAHNIFCEDSDRHKLDSMDGYDIQRKNTRIKDVFVYGTDTTN